MSELIKNKRALYEFEVDYGRGFHVGGGEDSDA